MGLRSGLDYIALRAGHHHGSDMPTSARAILHHTDQKGPNILKGSVVVLYGLLQELYGPKAGSRFYQSKQRISLTIQNQCTFTYFRFVFVEIFIVTNFTDDSLKLSKFLS